MPSFDRGRSFKDQLRHWDCLGKLAENENENTRTSRPLPTPANRRYVLIDSVAILICERLSCEDYRGFSRGCPRKPQICSAISLEKRRLVLVIYAGFLLLILPHISHSPHVTTRLPLSLAGPS